MSTKESRQGTSRATAVIVGVLFIIGTVAGVSSALLTAPILGDTNVVSKVAENQNQMVTAALLVLTMGLALAIVPVVIFPVLRKHNEVLAIGYVVFRGALETVAVIALVITWFFLVILGREYAAAGAGAGSELQALGAIVQQGADPINALGGIVFNLGALMLYYVFYQSRLIPRWISVWGVIGILLNFSTHFLVLFNMQSPFSTANTLMNLTILLQEMVMAVWLIAKGFNPAANAAVSAKPTTNALLSAS